MRLRNLFILLLVLLLSSSPAIFNEEYMIDETPDPLKNLFENSEERISPDLLDVLEGQSNEIPERIIVYSESPDIGVTPILPAVKIGASYFQVLSGVNEASLRDLYLDQTISYILSDQKIDYTSSKDKPITESFDASEIIGVDDVNDTYGYTGEGVTIGLIDSGLDFGASDLVDAAALSSDGYLDSFDVTGTGLAITTDAFQPITSQGKQFLPLEDVSLTVFIGERGSLESTESLGIQLSNLEITNLSVPSVSGDYLVGMAYQGGLTEDLPSQYFLFVLIDSTVSRQYDTIYVDMETSLAITLVQGGYILPSGRSFIELNEFDLGVSGLPFVEGIDPLGRAIGMIFDPVGHGALSASVLASRGVTEFPIFDNPSTETVENATKYRLPGSASGAKIIASKALTLTDFIFGWFWTGGLRLTVDRNEVAWEGSAERTVDVSSNSWGYGTVTEADLKAKGMDTTSLLLERHTI
ncbi:MAG: hypothetical protein ACXAE3_13770 [Candidatus Kariarchaeaceae archaeon]